MATARKELSRTEADGKETIVNEIIHFDFDKDISFDIDCMFDDWEYAQNHGVRYDDDSLWLIEVTPCLDEIEDRIMRDETPDKEDSQSELRIKAYLEKFRGFDIWV